MPQVTNPILPGFNPDPSILRVGEDYYIATSTFEWFPGALEGQPLTPIGPVLDASILSDECGGHQAHGSFTGAFVGVAASDLNGTALPAQFDYFTYRPVHDPSDRYEI